VFRLRSSSQNKSVILSGVWSVFCDKRSRKPALSEVEGDLHFTACLFHGLLRHYTGSLKGYVPFAVLFSAASAPAGLTLASKPTYHEMRHIPRCTALVSPPIYPPCVAYGPKGQFVAGFGGLESGLAVCLARRGEPGRQNVEFYLYPRKRPPT
jgi:hypothetical protein